MELQLVIRDTRNGVDVYQSSRIAIKNLDKATDPAKLIKDNVDKMRKVVDGEFEKLFVKELKRAVKVSIIAEGEPTGEGNPEVFTPNKAK